MTTISNEQIYDLLQKLDGKVDVLTDKHSDLSARVSSLETANGKAGEVTRRWLDLQWPAHEAHHAEFAKRVDAIEEKTEQRIDAVGMRVAELEQFRSKAGVYMAIAAMVSGALASGLVALVFTLLEAKP